MEINYFKRKKFFKTANYLELTPFAKYDSIEEDGKYFVIIPKFKNQLINKFIPPNKQKPIRVKLDEFGAEVWKQIDGKTKVFEICEKLSDKFGEKIQPAEQRLTQFLTMLYNNKLISYNEILKTI